MAYVISDDCTACGTCVDECPSEAIEESGNKYSIDQDKCTECGTCVDICPQEAIAEEWNDRGALSRQKAWESK